MSGGELLVSRQPADASARVPTVHSAAAAVRRCELQRPQGGASLCLIYLFIFIYLFIYLGAGRKKTNFFCQNTTLTLTLTTTTTTTTIMKMKLRLISADSLFLSDVTETKRKKNQPENPITSFILFIIFLDRLNVIFIYSFIVFLAIIILYSLCMCIFSFHLCGSMYSQILAFLYHSVKNYNEILCVQMKNVLLLLLCEVTKGKATQSYNPPAPPPYWDIETEKLNDKNFCELLLARLPVNLITYRNFRTINRYFFPML